MTMPDNPWAEHQLVDAAALYQGVLDLIGDVAAATNTRGNSATGNTDANGYATVPHGLPFTPSRVLVQNTGAADGAHGWITGLVDTITATTFRVRLFTTTGGGTTQTLAAANAKAFTFDWIAIP